MSQHDTQVDATIMTEDNLALIAEWMHPEQVYIPTSYVRKLFASHVALAKKFAAAQATIAAQDARIGELTKALQAYADDRNWNSCYVSEAGEPIEPFSYWCRGGDDEPWMIAEAALAAAPDQEAAR